MLLGSWSPAASPSRCWGCAGLTCPSCLALQAGDFGGALYLDVNDGVAVSKSSFGANTAGLGGGAVFLTTANFPFFHINQTLLQGNRVGRVPAGNVSTIGSGGAITAVGSLQLAINGSEVLGNSAGKHGGAVFCRGCVNVELVGSKVLANAAASSGGAVTLERQLGNTLLADTLFSENECMPHGTSTSSSPEEVAAAGRAAMTEAGLYAGCTSSGGGGAVCAQLLGGLLELRNLTVSENKAAFGGGVFIDSAACGEGVLQSCKVALRGNKVQLNTAALSAGGIFWTKRPGGLADSCAQEEEEAASCPAVFANNIVVATPDVGKDEQTRVAKLQLDSSRVSVLSGQTFDLRAAVLDNFGQRLLYLDALLQVQLVSANPNVSVSPVTAEAADGAVWLRGVSVQGVDRFYGAVELELVGSVQGERFVSQPVSVELRTCRPGDVMQVRRGRSTRLRGLQMSGCLRLCTVP